MIDAFPALTVAVCGVPPSTVKVAVAGTLPSPGRMLPVALPPGGVGTMVAVTTTDCPYTGLAGLAATPMVVDALLTVWSGVSVPLEEL